MIITSCWALWEWVDTQEPSCYAGGSTNEDGVTVDMDVRRQANDNSFAEPQVAPRSHNGRSGRGVLPKVLMGLAVLLALSALAWLVVMSAGYFNAGSSVKAKQYQAVFLTNGQVYFGKVKNVNADYVKLEEIYYLQVQQTVQPKDGKATDNSNQEVSLAKLGGELHGPEDTMFINRDQVLFWENLKNDGKVAKAISDYKEAGNK